LLSDVDFKVVEPYGDNSRYWIGPKDPAEEKEELVVRLSSAFEAYRPPVLLRLFGSVLALPGEVFDRLTTGR